MGFVATDKSIHDLLDGHSFDEAVALQDALCTLRMALGHFPARIILLDPHRIPTFTRREIHPIKASPFNLNIRFAKASMALIAQTAIFQLRKKFPADIARWSSQLFTQKILSGIDRDLRVKDDTIIVTFYNAPKEYGLKQYFQNMPDRLERQGINPKIPWLYNFKVNYRFN